MKHNLIMVRFILVISMMLSFGACSSAKHINSSTQDNPVQQVYAVVSYHEFHLKKELGYSFVDLGAEVIALKPDLICGEIQEQDYRGPMEGYYPPEAAYLDSLAQENGLVFSPSDWRGDFIETQKADEALTPQERSELHSLKDIPDDFQREAMKDPFTAIHGPKFQEAIARFHDRRIAIGTELVDGYWIARNQVIVKKCMRKAQSIKAKTVVFVFGGHHKYIIEKYLKKYYGIEAAPVKKLYIPTNKPVADPVTERWKKNRKELIRLMNDRKTLPSIKAMIQDSSRIDKLLPLIEAKGLAN